MRVLLLSIAVVDDLLAIALIAVVFTAGISAGWLAAGLAVCGAYVAAFRYRLDRGWLLWLLAIACWICIHASGVHATVAGILLGLLTPVRPRAGETTGPSERIQHRLHPVSAAVCVPVFALAATGIGYIVSLLIARLAFDDQQDQEQGRSRRARRLSARVLPRRRALAATALTAQPYGSIQDRPLVPARGYLFSSSCRIRPSSVRRFALLRPTVPADAHRPGPVGPATPIGPIEGWSVNCTSMKFKVSQPDG